MARPSPLQVKIYTAKLRPFEELLKAKQTDLADLLAASEGERGSVDKEPERALRELDHEQFAKELRKLLEDAGIQDPDVVCDEGRYCFSGPMGSRLEALGENSPEQSAVHWLLTYRKVRGYEAKIAAAREGRDLPTRPAYPPTV